MLLYLVRFAFAKSFLQLSALLAGAPGAGASEEAAAGRRDSPAQAGSAAGADAGSGPGQAASSGASLRGGCGSSAAAPGASGLGGPARGLATSALEGDRGSQAGAGPRGGLGRVMSAAGVDTSDEEEFSDDDGEEEVRPGRTIHRRA